jgi:hypothetical protein
MLSNIKWVGVIDRLKDEQLAQKRLRMRQLFWRAFEPKIRLPDCQRGLS